MENIHKMIFHKMKHFHRNEKVPQKRFFHEDETFLQKWDFMSEKDIAEQTDRVIRNLDAVVSAAGATLADVVKTTVYLSNMNDFATMNEVYEKYFSDAAPARAAVEVSRLPKDALIEIDAILVIPS